MRFDIRVLSPANELSRLTIEAASEADARRQLESQSLQIVTLQAIGQRMSGLRWRRRQFSVLLFCQELHALLLAGLTLMEALEGLIEKDAASESRTVLQRLINIIRDGSRFSDALTTLPDVFPPLLVGLMKAAESTGDIPSVLARYVAYQQRVDVVRNKIISSSIYPAILLLVGTAVTAFLGGYVVPRFATIYQDTGRELPFMSALMLKFGAFVSTNTAMVGGVTLFLVAIVAGSFWHLSRTGALSRWAARLPGVGVRIRLYETSRLYLTLGMLLESGIPIVSALAMSEGVVSRRVLMHLQQARAAIESGALFSDSFQECQLTTAISYRMLRVGERSGQLGDMLIQASNFYEGDITRFIDRFTRAFEPILMMIIGLVVGGIVVLLYMPIFDLATTLQ